MNYKIENKEAKVLDKGFVRVVDIMGDDNSIIQSARVSYNEGSKGEEKDKKLINYLMENKHTSPFEHCMITLHIKAPLFVVAQWVRHRTWSYNFVSYRYTEPNMEFYEPTDWRGQSKDNKQMSNGVVKEVAYTLKFDDTYGCLQGSPAPVSDNIECQDYWSIIGQATDWYDLNVENGMSREMARIALPQSLYTEFYATVDLNNLLHFIRLRDHEHAQYEIREYAIAISNFVKEWVPYTWEAFQEHVLHSVTLSKTEKDFLIKLLDSFWQYEDKDLKQSIESYCCKNDISILPSTLDKLCKKIK